MIKSVKRKDLNELEYNACVENSIQGRLFAFSWYLDIVCTDWITLVYKNYEAVMPIPIREKYGVTYVYPPFWILEMGVFSKDLKIEKEFINYLLKKYRFVELRLNSNNSILNLPQYETRQFQILDMGIDNSLLQENFQSDRKKDLKKAEKFKLVLKWTDDPENLVHLFKNNVGKRTPEIKLEDYKNLKKLIDVCLEKGVGEILSIYQDEKIVASAFFLLYRDTVTILCSSTDFENRKNGANTFLINEAIKKYQSLYSIFNFGGSSMPSIAKYFFSFGATEITYPMIKQRRVPSLLKRFLS